MIDVANKSKCFGCGVCRDACKTNCITMSSDHEGFAYPQCEEYRCDNCSRCALQCPAEYPLETTNVPKVFACMNKNRQERIDSTSGGVFPILARKMLRENGVVFGAAFNEQFEVVHVRIDDQFSLRRLQGAKYSQSRIDGVYTDIRDTLDRNQKVLFSGTPCQVAAVRKFVTRNTENLLLVEIACHSVPSPKVFAYYIAALQEHYGNGVKSFYFRKKEKSWRDSQVVVEFENRTFSQSVYENSFTRGFFSGLYCRPSCHECRAKKQYSTADITLRDYWGIENSHPQMDDHWGTSLVLVRTLKGETYFQEVSAEMITQESDIISATKNNPYLMNSSKPHRNRTEFFKKFDTLIHETPDLKKFQELINSLL